MNNGLVEKVYFEGSICFFTIGYEPLRCLEHRILGDVFAPGLGPPFDHVELVKTIGTVDGHGADIWQQSGWLDHQLVRC